MKQNFFGFDPSFHVARDHFVRKVPRSRTPSISRGIGFRRDRTTGRSLRPRCRLPGPRVSRLRNPELRCDEQTRDSIGPAPRRYNGFGRRSATVKDPW